MYSKVLLYSFSFHYIMETFSVKIQRKLNQLIVKVMIKVFFFKSTLLGTCTGCTLRSGPSPLRQGTGVTQKCIKNKMSPMKMIFLHPSFLATKYFVLKLKLTERRVPAPCPNP